MNQYKRVRYQKSPLLEVIFQLRFPTILSINTNQPSTFQEKIRELYPFFQEGNEQQKEFFLGADGIPKQVGNSETKNYAFISPDGQSKINLTASFISFSTLRYTQWEEFLEKIRFIIPIFEDIYEPSFYTRIGLRYIDAITREDLGLQQEKWSDLIEPHILGLISSDFEDGIHTFKTIAEYENPKDKTYIKTHFELVHINNRRELSFLIDCDYFAQSITNKDKVYDIANDLHTNSSHFISSAFTEKLHQAMEPIEI